MSTITPVLVWKDQATIDKITSLADSSLSYPQAIVSAYNAIPGLPAFTAQSWIDIFMDLESFIEGLNVGFYQANYAAGHATLGFSQEYGMSIIDPSLYPNFSAFRSKIKDFNDYCSSMVYLYISSGSYTIDSGSVIVNQAFVDTITAQYSFYLNTQTEIDTKSAIDNFITALEALNTIIPQNAFRLVDRSQINAGPDLNDLKQIIKVTMPHGQQLPVFTYDLNFLKKVQQVVIHQQLP